MNRSNLFILQWLSFVLLLVNYTVVPCYSSELSMDIDNSQNGDIDSKPIIRLKPGEIPERPSGSTEIVKRRCKFCNKFKKELTIDEYIDPSGKHVKVILRRRYRPIFSGLRRWRQRKSTRARARKAFKNNKQKSLSKKLEKKANKKVLLGVFKRFNKKKSDKRHPSQKNLQSLGIDKQDLSDGSAVPTEHSKDIKYSGINKMPDIEYNENDNISNIGYNKVDTLLSNEYSEADTLSNSEYSQTDKIPSLEYNQNSEDIFSNEVVTGINGSE
ncbi:uncharacterized protein CMU_027100 [Cryptosporidium muris RN66]|uniref:Uncharacterized protein n=1 Tax=Cryptosporidium muris (strain RN66) TaxID=441375 RepID=B6ABE9_CRYMR|nr:uncharacterized protein CMU_027100 [Cryptosporidium muris RN66]EEA05701.1 hypothetical protein, conserved [Cryptosporidium muris RN66]|eukprot:XP_002140050.1 hypothetical protein [Cryptosporidium muris RN66]